MDGLIALIALLGLIPLWRSVLRRVEVPDVAPRSVATQDVGAPAPGPTAVVASAPVSTARVPDVTSLDAGPRCGARGSHIADMGAKGGLHADGLGGRRINDPDADAEFLTLGRLVGRRSWRWPGFATGTGARRLGRASFFGLGLWLGFRHWLRG